MGTANAVPAWTWTDSSGQVHYSDTPVPGARKIELGSAQGFGPTDGSSARRATQPVTSTAPARGYTAIRIVNPTQQQTLWNTAGVLTVSLTTDPGLRDGDSLDLAVDGQRKNLATTSTEITLQDVFRGLHTVEVIVFDRTGTELARSAPTTFIVQQTSIANPK
jgi:hypothetical protein